MQDRLSTTLEQIRTQFGFSVKTHRIGEMDIRIAEIARPDEAVPDIYPASLENPGNAPVWMITWPAVVDVASFQFPA